MMFKCFVCLNFMHRSEKLFLETNVANIEEYDIVHLHRLKIFNGSLNL